MIVIVTKGRKRQRTLEAFPIELQKKVVFVTSKEDSAHLLEHYSVVKEKISICNEKGVAKARQHAVQLALQKKEKKLVFFDDDLLFSTRVDDWEFGTNAKLRKSTEEQVAESIDWMLQELDTYACVGLGARGGNNGIKNRWVNENYRIMRSFAVDVTVLQEHQIRFDDFYYWEDFHVALSLLELGMPNCVNVNHTTDGITNNAGGVVRDKNRMLQEAEKFLAKHPMAVLVHKKFNFGAKEEQGLEYPDFRIPWKKIYKHAWS